MINNIKDRLFSWKNITVLVQVFICYRMVINLIYSTEHPFQTQKDLYFVFASFWLVVLVFFLRKIPLQRRAVWISLAIELVIMAGYFVSKKIFPSRYGVDYFRIILVYWLICTAFIAMLVDVIFEEKVRETVRNNCVILVPFLIMGVIVVLYEKVGAIPILCPIVILLLTRISKERWMNLINCFACGYYIAFVHTMTKSLIQNPDRYQDGRYLGSFLELESGGVFCGGAVICMLYFIAAFIISDRKKWYKLAIPLVLIIYPVYAVVRITSRSTQISLALAIICIFVFIHKSQAKKTTIVRLIISLGVVVALFAAALLLSVNINKKLQSSNNVEISYWEAHIRHLTSEESRRGYFKDGSILNAFNWLSSERLAHWAESVKQIKLMGHPFDAFYFEGNSEPTTSPHNFYILWLVEYGLIGGGLVIAWFVYVGVIGIKRVLNHKREAILSFLWFVFCFGIFIFTCVQWESPISYGLLFLQYGLLDFDKKEVN